MNTHTPTRRQPVRAAAVARNTPAVSVQWAALGLAALMTFGTLGSIHTLSLSDTAAGTLARAAAVSAQA